MRLLERFLPVVLWSLLAWFSTRQLSPLGWSALWSVAGVGFGAFWLERNKSLPVRTGFIWFACLALATLAERIGHFGLQFSWPSHLLGSDRVIGLSLCLRAFAYWSCGFVAIRWSCIRRPLFSLVESGIFCLLVLWVFAGHQQGFINRPFFFVDPLWGRGIDPTPLFLLVGLAAVLVVSLFLGQGQVGVSAEREVDAPVGFTAVARPRWRLWNVVILACLLGALFVMLPAQKIREYSEKYGPADGNTPTDEKRYGHGKGKSDPSSRSQGAKPTPDPSGEPSSPTPNPSGQPARPTPGQDGQSGATPSPDPSGKPSNGSPSPTPGQDGQSGGTPSPDPSGKPASPSPTPGQDGQSGGTPSPDPSGKPASPSPTPGQDGQSGGTPSPNPSGKPSSGSPTPGSASPPPSQDPSAKPPDQSGSQPPPQQQPKFSNGPQSSKNQPVAVVVFKDDYQPECLTYYFRQNAFSQFNGIKLVASADGRFDRDIPLQYATHSRKQLPSGELAGMQLLPINPEYFKPISSRVAVLSQHARPFGLSNPVAFWACENPDPARFQKAFEVDSMALTLPYQKMVAIKPGQSTWSVSEWQHYLEGPTDQRYRKLAEQILKEQKLTIKSSSGFSKAVAIKLWLDEHCTYSLKSTSADSSDPVASFLFGDRTGYCVFTSHAAAYLYRAAGIPARIAEGYAVPSNSRGTGSALLVREREAHSWPEVYFEGLGWMALDVTPKKSVVPPEDQVDPGLQQMLGDMAREQPNDPPPDSPDQPHINIQELLKQLFIQLLAGLPWALGLTALFLLGVKVVRRLRPYTRWGKSDPSLLYYQAILDRLADRGWWRKSGSSRESFAEQLHTLVPSLKALTVMHLATRLGNSKASPEEARRLWQEAQQEVNRVPKTWRYYVRLLNPVSWWSVK